MRTSARPPTLLQRLAQLEARAPNIAEPQRQQRREAIRQVFDALDSMRPQRADARLYGRPSFVEWLRDWAHRQQAGTLTEADRCLTAALPSAALNLLGVTAEHFLMTLAKRLAAS